MFTLEDIFSASAKIWGQFWEMLRYPASLRLSVLLLEMYIVAIRTAIKLNQGT